MITFISMRSSDSPTYHEKRDAISHDWCRLLDSYGLSPVLIPNALEDPVRLLDKIPGRGLLLTGGDDIADNERDQTERCLLDEAIKRKIPVFGVCRGLQVINLYFGGELERRSHPSHTSTEHEIEVTDNLCGAIPLGKRTVNSYHQDCVTTDGLARELSVFAMAKDGIVEGLYHRNHAIMAIQWHPERENPGNYLDKSLFERWMQQCE